MSDIVIIGGGVIGLSLAYELAGQGASVRILEQSQFGQESSWAGAGMIMPGNPAKATTIEARLRAESFVRWPDWSQRLLDDTGIDNGFLNCGGIELQCSRHAPRDEPSAQGTRLSLQTSDLATSAQRWRSDGIVVEELAVAELRQLEPNLHPEFAPAIHLPQMCQVRNPRHLKALIAACLARGVELTCGTPVTGWERRGSRIMTAQTADGPIAAKQFVVCGGAWSQAILSAAQCAIEVEPVRGQIVLLDAPERPIRRIIEVGARYLVPRADGKLLIGSTEEWTGFDKQNTAEGVSELIRFATDLVPALKSARFDRCWSGLRPHAPRGLPYLGQAPDSDNLFVAAGHFRAGLMLSPITAILMRQLVLGQPTLLPLGELSSTSA